ncbi:segregation protein B [Megasphaera cerevisiae DSM 20462]|uniref:Selenide, water dikinase n=1 Tax=Megasphaera cerevisiae DSM 20462 TaxID=1122219 RepID=A0A0J6ZNZ0_9FIRM|nr:segregation protein B [Megasphaera cerevisiae DSM 20462]SJZ69672.1 selenophosphate synthase [Megasphaera cerevisiae DSM 20462]
MLEGIPTRYDERLIVGYDTSDDASVYVLNEELALVQTVDFFPPIVDDPFLFGQIAAANALSDVYAMGGEAKLAMNVMCINSQMGQEVVRAILQGGYDKAYEAGVLITGGHTIEDKEPKYGLSVTGFVHPRKLLRNSSAKEGDVLLLTKPLGVGILMTAARGDLVDEALLRTLYSEMAQLNKTARDMMVRYDVHGCTDVTGFGLLGHALEMARGSGLTLHLESEHIPYHAEACDMAEMGFVPAGAYRNRAYTQDDVVIREGTRQGLMDILYDPQTSGGLLIAVSEDVAPQLAAELQQVISCAEIIGYVTRREEKALIVE